jgi:hypothetical protein
MIDEGRTRAWLIGGLAGGQLVDPTEPGVVRVVRLAPGQGDALTGRPPLSEMVRTEADTYSVRRIILPGHPHPISVYAHESLRTEGDLLRGVGAQLVADARRKGTISPTSHVAGPTLTFDDRYQRQVCLWCGEVLEEYDLANIAVPISQPGPPATWPPGAWVRVEGPVAYTIDVGLDEPMPEDACARRYAIVAS